MFFKAACLYSSMREGKLKEQKAMVVNTVQIYVDCFVTFSDEKLVG